MGDAADDCYDIALAQMMDPHFVDEMGVQCRYCKRDGYFWEKTDHGWRLATATGKLHTCNKHPSFVNRSGGDVKEPS